MSHHGKIIENWSEVFCHKSHGFRDELVANSETNLFVESRFAWILLSQEILKCKVFSHI